MVKLFKILFFNSMIMGTLIAISAYSWLTSWIGLEINLLSLIPLLKTDKNKFPAEAAIKYLIAQMIGSSILLFSIISILITSKSLFYNEMNSMMILLSSALLLKMGAAPFHFGFPEIMSGLNWSNAFLMLTWQKIAPMILITHQIKLYTLFFSFIIIISSIIGGTQGLNQICMRKILAYSSINHIGWMISSILFSINIFYYYFLIYSFINFSIILLLNKYNIKFINQLNYIYLPKKINLLFMMNFLSLGGLPPFLGFLPKWLTINEMINNNNYFISTLLIIFTLMTLYFYLRITFSSFKVYSKTSLIIFIKKTNIFTVMMNMISMLGLILCSMIISTM